MNYDQWKLQTPPETPEPITLSKCAQCGEREELFVLGVESYGLKPDACVCSYCLNELHNNLSLTN